MTEQAVLDRDRIASNILKFTEQNKLHIHPGQDPYEWADLVIRKGGCPCVPGRSECPCDFVLEDLKELNRCRCGLFVNGAYLEEYNRLQAQLKEKKRWNRKPKASSSRRLA